MSKSEDAQPEIDLVWGCEAIGQVIGLNYHQTYHLLVTGQIPARKLGTRFVIERAKLLAVFRGEAA